MMGGGMSTRKMYKAGSANPREISSRVADYGFATSKANMGLPIPTDKTLAGNYGNMSYFKKGGRVGCGVAKKGFGKAMKKRRI